MEFCHESHKTIEFPVPVEYTRFQVHVTFMQARDSSKRWKIIKMSFPVDSWFNDKYVTV